MEKSSHSTSSSAMIMQEELLKKNFQSIKLIFRLGWISVILGVCTFIIHYITIIHFKNYLSINAGIISGVFLIIAGLASISAGYQETSYRCFKNAQIWSFIVNIIFVPGLIVISIAALITDSHNIKPICHPTLSSPRAILFGTSLEVYPSNISCIEITYFFNITQIFNTIQLIIGVICFIVHIILLSIQREVIQRMKMNENTNYINEKIITYPQAIILDLSQTTSHIDLPPRYEDLPSMQLFLQE